MHYEDLTGNMYNRLIAIRYVETANTRHANWLWRCLCGNEKVIAARHVKNGVTKSCGCLKREYDDKR